MDGVAVSFEGESVFEAEGAAVQEPARMAVLAVAS